MADTLPDYRNPLDLPPRPEFEDAPITPAIFTQALHRLEAITASFLEEGPLADKNPDDLLLKLEFQNDRAFADEAYPDALEITLLQLLHASTAMQKANAPNSVRDPIHDLIEEAFLEEASKHVIAELWPLTHSNDLTPEHIRRIDACARPYVSRYGLDTLNAAVQKLQQSAENTPDTVAPDTLPDYRASRFLQFRQERVPGDPATRELFARALRFLEAITDHFLESGDLWEKTPADLAYELGWHNAWHQFEAAAPKDGQPTPDTSGVADIPEVTLAHLQALSRRRLRAFDDTGWNLTQFYRPIEHLDRLINLALSAEQALDALTTQPSLKATGEALSPRSAAK